ncbi:MAG: sulfotransferase [Pseudomonadota bacterium]
MKDPILLYGIGATKAGTTWLYRALAARDDCALGAVKELHYWDTLADPQLGRQLRVCQRKIDATQASLSVARAQGRARQVRSLERRASSLADVLKVLEGDRQSHTAYAAYLMKHVTAETRLVADITPAYGLSSPSTFAEMAALTPEARFIYLMRDPLSRLWSAVRMQVSLRGGEGPEMEKQANGMLWRVLQKDHEKQVTVRGDYKRAISSLDSAVPPERRKIMFMEELITQRGYDEFCDWVGLPRRSAPVKKKVHEGAKAQMNPGFQSKALEMLQPQYEFVREYMGRLPEAWSKRLEMP